MITQVVAGLFLLGNSKRVSQWLTKDLADIDKAQPNLQKYGLVFIIQITGLVLFGISFQLLMAAFPSLFFKSEQSLLNPIFLTYFVQMVFSIALVLKASSLSKLIQRFNNRERIH